MQFKLSAIALALVTLAVATPTSRNTADIECCSSLEEASSPIGVAILKLFGIDPSSVTGLIGVSCSPITVVGAGNGACSGTTALCQDNSHSIQNSAAIFFCQADDLFAGLISLGCVPVTV
ncbi:hydrophobin 2 [Mycena floridula]|nr:hydrophobin 2 [Mycena floridula]KAJ7574993.1 hydrophobin 2 [Mycena floridula]KAJ7584285.1 hydrophobin 2 [Mycena floridula]